MRGPAACFMWALALAACRSADVSPASLPSSSDGAALADIPGNTTPLTVEVEAATERARELPGYSFTYADRDGPDGRVVMVYQFTDPHRDAVRALAIPGKTRVEHSPFSAAVIAEAGQRLPAVLDAALVGGGCVGLGGAYDYRRRAFSVGVASILTCEGDPFCDRLRPLPQTVPGSAIPLLDERTCTARTLP